MAHLDREGLLPSYLTRRRLARRYLRGAGLEIGALDHPLAVPPGVLVTYVDYQTREENLRRYPGLDPARVVEAQIIEDGLSLASVNDASQDFLVANHVLEHAGDPIQAVINWCRVLRPGGILFLAVPNGGRCFDRDRPITTLEHLQADHDAALGGDTELAAHRDREHYREWLACSVPRIHAAAGLASPPLSPAEREARIAEMAASREEIHYHVFSRRSLQEFMALVTARHLPGLRLLQVARSPGGAEFVVIARKETTS
jgi:SAM-dependent methyltransferase